jgi:hypothetical protein
MTRVERVGRYLQGTSWPTVEPMIAMPPIGGGRPSRPVRRENDERTNRNPDGIVIGLCSQQMGLQYRCGGGGGHQYATGFLISQQSWAQDHEGCSRTLSLSFGAPAMAGCK